jgi:hypothetical protein
MHHRAALTRTLDSETRMKRASSELIPQGLEGGRQRDAFHVSKIFAAGRGPHRRPAVRGSAHKPIAGHGS